MVLVCELAFPPARSSSSRKCDEPRIFPATEKAQRETHSKGKCLVSSLGPAIALEGPLVEAMSGEHSSFPADDGANPRGISSPIASFLQWVVHIQKPSR